jgi:hypothetical protein
MPPSADKERFPGNPYFPWKFVVEVSLALPSVFLFLELAWHFLVSAFVLGVLYFTHPIYRFLRKSTDWFAVCSVIVVTSTLLLGVLGGYIAPGYKVLWVILWILILMGENILSIKAWYKIRMEKIRS